MQNIWCADFPMGTIDLPSMPGKELLLADLYLSAYRAHLRLQSAFPCFPVSAVGMPSSLVRCIPLLECHLFEKKNSLALEDRTISFIGKV